MQKTVRIGLDTMLLEPVSVGFLKKAGATQQEGGESWYFTGSNVRSTALEINFDANHCIIWQPLFHDGGITMKIPSNAGSLLALLVMLGIPCKAHVNVEDE
jgi:hypothetical protein